MTDISSSQASSHRVGLLVLGMHRSGTSALSRLLNIFGASLPVRLIAANHGNEEGHWESATIAEFNDRILDSAGSCWNDCQPINPDWYNSLVHRGFAAQARELLLSEFEDSPLFVFKDPRNCRIARFWLDALDAEAITPAIIVPIRHPDEVAGSLERRDAMGIGYGHLLWLRHVLDAEAGTRGRNRLFTTYHELLADWRNVMKKFSEHFDLIWPRSSFMSATEADAFLDKRNVRLDAPTRLRKGADLVSWLSDVYFIATKWSVSGEDAADHAILDRITMEFDQAINSLGMALLPSQHGGQPGEGERRRIELEARLADSVAALDQNRAHIVEFEAVIEQLRHQLATDSADMEALKSRHDAAEQARIDREADSHALCRQIEQAEAALGEARRETDRLGEEEQRLRAELEVQATLLAEAQSDNEALKGLLSEQEANVGRLEREEEGLRHDNAHLASNLVQRREELEQAYTKIEEAEQQVEQVKANHQSDKTALEQALSDRGDDLASMTQDCEAAQKLAEDIAAREQQLLHDKTALEQALSDRGDDLASMTQEREAAQKLAEDIAAREQQLLHDKAALEQALSDRGDDLSSMTQEREAAQKLAEDIAAREQQLLHDKAALEQALSDQAQQLASVTQGRETARDLAASIAARESQLLLDKAKLEAQLVDAANMQAHTDAQLTAKNREAEQLQRSLNEKDAAEKKMQDNLEWMRRVNIVMNSPPIWWQILLPKYRKARQQRRLKRLNLFDSQKYLNSYPDVAEGGLDPLEHYLLHGMAEGRRKF